MEADSKLTMEIVPVGRNSAATVTAKIGADVLLVEKLDLARSKAREAFAAKLTGRSLEDGVPYFYGRDRALGRRFLRCRSQPAPAV